jgi:hypothetical protein
LKSFELFQKIQKYFSSPPLKLEHGIILDIAHVNFCAIFFDIGMFFAHEPADVREEEASLRV